MQQLQKIHLQPVKDGWKKERKITKEPILHLFPFLVISQSPLSPAPTPLLRREAPCRHNGELECEETPGPGCALPSAATSFLVTSSITSRVFLQGPWMQPGLCSQAVWLSSFCLRKCLIVSPLGIHFVWFLFYLFQHFLIRAMLLNIQGQVWPSVGKCWGTAQKGIHNWVSLFHPEIKGWQDTQKWTETKRLKILQDQILSSIK